MNRWYRTLFASLAIATLFALLAACGDDSSSGSGHSPSSVEDDEIVEEGVISGYVQKGPFSKGSSIIVQELSRRTLLSTGINVEGKVLNDSGAYSIKLDGFESPYVLVKAEGTFLSELTDTLTNAPIVLYALSNVANRNKVNVNLLTHLSYMRAFSLMKVSKSFDVAKREAEREVLAAFGITGEFPLAEDLDIHGTGDGDIALLALSVLVLGGLSEDGFVLSIAGSNGRGNSISKLESRMVDFVADIDEDGVWDDEKGATKIADWAAGQSLNGKLDRSYKSIAKIVNHFWWDNYGLGDCDAENEKREQKNENTLSTRSGEYFICNDGRWRLKNDMDGNLVDTTDVKDTAQVADTSVVDTSVVDTAGVADTSTVDTSGVGDTTVVDTLSDFEKDIGGQRCTYFGRIVHGVVDTNNVYFCDGVEWKRFYGNESTRYYQLTDDRDGQIYRYVNIGIQNWMAENLNYGDTAYSWNQAKEACPSGWHLPSKEEWNRVFKSISSTSASELDKYGFATRPAGQTSVSYWTSSFNKDSQGKHPYTIDFSNTGTGLSTLSEPATRYPVRCVQDYETFSACDEENLHRVMIYSGIAYYVCEEDGWHMMNVDEYNEYKWMGGEDGKTVWDGSNPRLCYVYENGAWNERDSSNCRLGLGGCIAAFQDSILQASNGTQYICDNLAWRWVTHLDIDTRGWGLDFEEGTVRKADCVKDHYYVFQDGKWRYGTEMDSILVSRGGTACLHVGDTSTVAYAGKYYKCMENVDSDVPQEWIALTALYNDTHDDLAECSATGLYGGGNLHNKFDDESRVYACDDGEFRHVKRAERLLGRGCTSYNRGEKLQMNLSHFACSDSGWVIDQETRGDGVMVDPRDGKTYRTIGIWKQTWMAENMNYTDATELTVLRGRIWCYDDDPEKCNEYGTLYGCAAALEVCPDGWRLPVRADIDSIIAFYQNIGWRRGTELRSATGWTDYDGESMNGSDFSGFTLLPAGLKNGDGSYEGESHEAWFWYDTGCADDVRRYAVYANYEGFFGYWYKDDAEAGYYVRCIKDEE